MEQQLQNLAKDLRVMGIRGKVEGGRYLAPKHCKPHALESRLRSAGWLCINHGQFHTDWSDVVDINNRRGKYQKNGVDAFVSWGSTAISTPPQIHVSHSASCMELKST